MPPSFLSLTVGYYWAFTETGRPQDSHALGTAVRTLFHPY